MNTRSLIQAAFILASLPLAACSSGDDDTNGTGGTGGGGNVQASPWAGHTYTLTTTKFDWSKPRGLGKDIENVMPVFMFQMTTTSGNDMTAKIGTAPKTVDANGDPVPGAPIVQDTCTPTIEVPVSGGAYPNSQIGPTTASLHLVSKASDPGPADDVQVTATVTGLKFTNVLPNGATKSMEGILDALMDIKEIAPLFTALGMPGVPPSTEAVCGELEKQGSPCEACPSGTMTCLTARAELIGADDAPGLTVNTVTLDSRPATCKNTY